MQKIEIQKLTVPTLIGVYEWERESLTNLVMSFQIWANLSNAMVSDNVQDTIDYAAVANEAKAFAAQTSFELLEALGSALAAHLMQTFNIHKLIVCIEKPEILPDAQTVSVSMGFDKNGPVCL